MSLYSVQHFTTGESTTHSDRAVLIPSDLAIAEWYAHHSIDPYTLSLEYALKMSEGDSTVLAVKMQSNGGPLIAEGYRITRLPDYRMNRVVWCEESKEHVILSNGRCVLDHSTPDTYRDSHTISCPGSGTLTEGDGQRTATCYVCKRQFPLAAMEYNALIVPSHFNINQCQYAPSEAIALRVFISAGSKVTVAWTYRGVNPCDLWPVRAEVEERVRAEFSAVMSKRRSARFVGRI